MAILRKNKQTELKDSITKAREAQKKFEETKAKVEAAKAKAEAVVQKAKALRQTVRQLNASRSTPGGVKGGVAAIVATQIGGLRGKLVSQIQGRVVEMLSSFSGECPNTAELQRILKIRNTLIGHLSKFEKRINKFGSMGTSLTKIIKILKTIVKVIKAIPIPTSVPPGAGIPINILTKYSDILIQVDKKIDKFSAEAEAIAAMAQSAKPLIDNLKSRLDIIDGMIQQCSLSPSADLSAILTTAQPQGSLNPKSSTSAGTGGTGTGTGTGNGTGGNGTGTGNGTGNGTGGNGTGTGTGGNGTGGNGTGAGTGNGTGAGTGNGTGNGTGAGTGNGTGNGTGAGTGTGNGTESFLSALNKVNGVTGTSSGTGSGAGNGTGNGSGATGTGSVTGGTGTGRGGLDYSYKGYTLAILQDTATSRIAPRRYAIASDARGVVVFRGPLSFSSSTQVLLDEIKFRIDNKLA